MRYVRSHARDLAVMDRRRFLRLAGVAGAGAIAGCVNPRSTPSPTPTGSSTASASPSPTATARPPDWEALARALRGELVRPSSPAYDRRRVLYNTRFDAIRPQGVARCASADDVRECVAFASSTGVPLALRSGGDSFGVVTSLTLRTHAASVLALGFLSWPWSAANAVIAAWQNWMGQAPDALWSNLHLDADLSGAQLTLYAVHSGTTASLGAQLDRLDALSGVRANRSVGSRSFMDTMLVDAGCLGRTVSQCHLAGDTPDGALQRETYAAKSIVATAPLSTATIAALTDGLVGPIEGDSHSVIFDGLGGAVARLAADATAFPHRGAAGVLQFVQSWAAGASVAQTQFRAYHDRVRVLAGPAAYANYADPDLTDWQQAYYGANYARLQRVKRAYDPKELFTFPQAIRPA